jgi:hypothetical protein
MVVDADANEMLTVGLNFIGFPPGRSINHSEKTNLGHFQSAYGIEPNVCSIIFRDIQQYDLGQSTINKPKVSYFLMTLYWLKRYPVESISAGIFGYHEDTVRKWVWTYSRAIQALKPYKVSTILFLSTYKIVCTNIFPF